MFCKQTVGVLAKFITFAEKLLENFKLGAMLWISDSSGSWRYLEKALFLQSTGSYKGAARWESFERWKTYDKNMLYSCKGIQTTKNGIKQSKLVQLIKYSDYHLWSKSCCGKNNSKNSTQYIKIFELQTPNIPFKRKVIKGKESLNSAHRNFARKELRCPCYFRIMA